MAASDSKQLVSSCFRLLFFCNTESLQENKMYYLVLQRIYSAKRCIDPIVKVKLERLTGVVEGQEMKVKKDEELDGGDRER